MNYWGHWKLGWMALGFIIICNIVLGLVYAGIAFLLGNFVEKPMLYAAALGWLLVGAPFAGWLFKTFAGAVQRRAG